METLGFALTTNVVSTFIGKQILGQAISDASGSIYGSMASIFRYSSKIDETILKLDIKERLKTINSLTKDIQNYSDAVEKCLSSVHDVIIEIKQDLKLIESKIKNHKNKYFSGWRKVGCTKELKILNIHSNLLEKRLDYLLKALEIARCNKVLSNGNFKSSNFNGKTLVKFRKKTD